MPVISMYLFFCFLSNSCFLAWALSSCLQKNMSLNDKIKYLCINLALNICIVKKGQKTQFEEQYLFAWKKSKELNIIGKNLYDNIPFWKTISLLGPMQQILDIQFIHPTGKVVWVLRRCHGQTIKIEWLKIKLNIIFQINQYDWILKLSI